MQHGSLAQLGEHLPYKQRVIGSSPIVSTTFQGESLDSYGLVVQLVRTPPCHGGGRGFESHPGRHYADLAHLVERHLAKVEVASSSLVIRSIFSLYILVVSAKVGACASSDCREKHPRRYSQVVRQRTATP